MRQPIDLVGGFYTDESLPWSCQDTVNYLPVAAEAGGTRTPTKLVDVPGLRPWLELPGPGPIRGIHDVEGRLFVVTGRWLYEVRGAEPKFIGVIPGVGRVSMSHNQKSVGNELLVVNGSGGYVWDTGTEEFTVVTDDGYPGAFAVDFLDGYLMQVEPFGRFLFHSDLADALDYNTLDRFEAETAPDRVVGMIVNHREVWAFGERTIDIFDNVGTATGTFQNKGISLSRGCIAKWSPAVIDNGIAWLGDDRVVYHARGYDAVRISTRAIEVALSECSLTDIRNAFSFVWADRGHAVYYLTVPNGQTFGYDFSTGLWHRRASWHPERDISGRWRASDLVRHNGRWIAGDYQNSRLYELDWDFMREGEGPLVRERVTPVAHDDGRRITLDSVELFYDVGEQVTREVTFPPKPPPPPIPEESLLWVVSRADNIYGLRDFTTLAGAPYGPTGGVGTRQMGAVAAFDDLVVSGQVDQRYTVSEDHCATFNNAVFNTGVRSGKSGIRTDGGAILQAGPTLLKLHGPSYSLLDVLAEDIDNIHSVIRHGSRILYAAGLANNRSRIVASDDEGATWSVKFVRDGVYSGLSGLATNGTRITSIMLAPNAGDIVIYSDDGGDTWSSDYSYMPPLPSGDETELFMSGSANGFLCSMTSFCMRSDDGVVWEESDISRLPSGVIRHNGIAFNQAMIAGSNGLLGFSRDNGRTFHPVAGHEDHAWLTVFPIVVPYE